MHASSERDGESRCGRLAVVEDSAGIGPSSGIALGVGQERAMPMGASAGSPEMRISPRVSE